MQHGTYLTKMQNEINRMQQCYIDIPLLLMDFKLLTFKLLIQSNILICHYFAIAIYYFLLLLIYFNYHLSFPVNGFYLKSIISYLVCRNPQHKVTSTNLWRQFSILLCQMLEALGQALTFTDTVFCFGPVTHLVLIRLRGSVYYSCSQHLSRTGSSYQCIKTDLKISVQL